MLDNKTPLSKDDILEIPKETIDKATISIDHKKSAQRGGFGGGGGGGGRHGGAGGFAGDKPKAFKKTFSRLLKYLKPHIFKIIVVMLFVVIGTVLSALGPTISGQALNLIQHSIVVGGQGFLVEMPLKEIYVLIISGVIIYILSAISSYVGAYVIAGVSQKVVYELRKELKIKLDRLPIKYFDENQYGEILSRITNDIDTIQTTLQQSITQVLTAIFTLISVTAMMIYNGGAVFIVCLITFPISLVITIIIAKLSQKQFKKQAKNLGNLNGHIEEMYSGYKVIKVFNMQDESQQKFDEINKKLYQSNLKSQTFSGLTNPLMKFVGYINYFFIVLIGAFQVINGQLEGIGNISAMLQYSNRFNEPILTTSQFINVMQNAVAAAERVFEVLDAKEEDTTILPDVDLTNVKGRVTFKDVSFSYSDDTELISEMNLSLNPGDSVAIVGPTGAGKTTLVNLLMKFYDIDGGKIFIDDIDIATLSRSNLRGIYGMVLQETWLFKGSIRENIMFGNMDATKEEVVEAAKKAHAHDFIVKLPDGYETLLNEDATNISNGQRQLLTIARALLSDPKILILDEATSSVDTRTEQYIQTALTRMMKDRTSFVIAHRLSTIKNANLILVMNKGHVIEQGTHDQLLSNGGFYYNLYNSQFNEQPV